LRHCMNRASTGTATHRQAARNNRGGISPTPIFITVQLTPQIRVTRISAIAWLAVSGISTASNIERELVGVHGQFALASGTALDAYRFRHLAAAGQNF